MKLLKTIVLRFNIDLSLKFVSSLQINVLLRAVKDFNPDDGDCFYTMGVVDLLMECVELSYRPGELKLAYYFNYDYILLQ